VSVRSKAVQFSAPRTVELVGVDVPEPGRGEALLRVRYSGISAGTEMLAYRGEVDADLPLDEKLGALGGTFSFPFRFGYSCVGTVERSSGRLPEGARVFAFHPHQAHFVAPEADLIEIGSDDLRSATMLPYVETALQITLDAGAVAHSSVVVSGLGVLGILTGALLARAGATVIGIEPSPFRREVAAHFGIETADPSDAGDVIGRLSPAGVGLAVEASGNPAALAGVLDLLAHEGVVLVASWYGSKPVALPLGGRFHRRRLTIRSTQVSTIPAHLSGTWTIERRRTVAVTLLDELPLKRLATHQFPLARAAEAFALVDKGEPDLIHAALSYEEGV
jgi:2-desacetyl-2-hydroxyethyl bacteriochlorophyllide A dehydrogenase